MKNTLLAYLCVLQVTESSSFSRGEYKGFYINDDECPLATYSLIEHETKLTRDEIKKDMIEMRNEGLIELLHAVNGEGCPNGSGWSITEKGLAYAVENNLVTKEENL